MPGVRKWNVVLGVTLHRASRSGPCPTFSDWHAESRLVARMTYSTSSSRPQQVVLGSSRRIAKSAQVTHAGPDRILVVEDEVRVAEFIRDALIDIGYAVTVAAGDADALNKVAEDPPDLRCLIPLA